MQTAVCNPTTARRPGRSVRAGRRCLHSGRPAEPSTIVFARGVRGARAPRSSRLREVRAVELLERIHSPEARQVLETLAGGAEQGVVTVEARNARVRLSGRPES